MINALIGELTLRNVEINHTIETIYFGGGTPSILTNADIIRLLDTIYELYEVSENPEITLEANPDDLSPERIKLLAQTPINRLSIGIQSFFDEDLVMMNRAHSAKEAQECLSEAVRYFDNITLDLIYGIPGMDEQKWMRNIQIALSYNIPHISSYALTVEPKTALHSLISRGLVASVDEAMAQKHFEILVDVLESAGFKHYEFSNFGKEGYFSRNNTAYWLGTLYLGIGPSAHSYDGKTRSWNVANNSKYINSIREGIIPSQIENLTLEDRYNEYIMTGLRTMWGVSLKYVEQTFGTSLSTYALAMAEKHILNGLIKTEKNAEMGVILRVTSKGKFLSDGLASDLFWVS